MPPSVSRIQHRLEVLDPTDDKYRPLLYELLSHQDLEPHVQGLQESGLEGFVEVLDKALSHSQATDDLFRKALQKLQSTCSNREVLPRSHLIRSERLSNRGEAIASGCLVDAHEAELDGGKVCVRALRSSVPDTGGDTKKVFYEQVVVWKRLQHPNIVPFLGVPAEISPFEIVCDWMENDTITEYVRKNPEVDRVELLWDVADGLHYLHSSNVVHGDLTITNVLIDSDGHARLTGFGLKSIVQGDNSSMNLQDPNATNAMTWAAPEILERGPVSKEGDVFTFAMVAVETFTGSPPFDTNPYIALLETPNGNRPGRPATLQHDGLWEIMTRSWSESPRERPTASELLEFFQVSFQRKGDAPKAPPPPSTLTRTLTPSSGKHTDTTAGPGSDSSTGREPRDQPAPPPPGPTPSIEKPSPPVKGKPSLFKRAGRKLKEFMRSKSVLAF